MSFTFENRLRLRVSGILVDQGRILLIKHHLSSYDLWAPPGGEVEYGESLKDALCREYLEECNLEVSVGRFLFVHEFLEDPLHAVEIFFEVTTQQFNAMKLGADPEHISPILKDLTFFYWEDMKQLDNMKGVRLHSALLACDKMEDLYTISFR